MLATQGLVHHGKIQNQLLFDLRAQVSVMLLAASWHLAFVFWWKIYVCINVCIYVCIDLCIESFLQLYTEKKCFYFFKFIYLF